MSKGNPRITLGVVAISCNEERDLPGFLENLLPWMDEIVIIDDGSTDRTREVAEAAGAKDHLWVYVSICANGLLGEPGRSHELIGSANIMVGLFQIIQTAPVNCRDRNDRGLFEEGILQEIFRLIGHFEDSVICH